MKIEDVKIDKEFKALIDDGHTVDQIKGLIDDIQANGFLDPIVVWKQEGILLDGHTRHGIWERWFKGTSAARPPVVELSFPSRLEAKRWMLLHQLSRRNLNQTRAAYYRGLLYNELKLDQNENLNRGEDSPICHSDTSGETAENQTKTTAETIAEQTGISPSTANRDAAFAKAVDKIAEVNSKAAADIRDGKLGDRKTAVAIAKLSSDDIRKAIGNLRNGRKWNDGIVKAAPPPKKPKPGKGKSPAKFADDLSRKHVGPLVRGIDKLAEQNGGKGDAYAEADSALNAFVGALKKMREGQK